MKECIVLAGGLGTRLQSVVKDVPKCMAEVAQKPFLEHLFDYLAEQQVEHVIVALGYKSEIVIDWMERRMNTFHISFVVENEPLGTGGAIRLALNKVRGNQILVMNGDTFFDIDTNQLITFHEEQSADISLALKPMQNFDRYGSVVLNSQKRIIQFNEKQFCEQGLINGGIYLINRKVLEEVDLPDKFSFEKEILEGQLENLQLYGCEMDNYFIDIGIPADLEKANRDFKSEEEL